MCVLVAFLTKNRTSEEPITKKIHYYDHTDQTLCGHIFNNRWALCPDDGKFVVTCKKCIRKREDEELIEKAEKAVRYL